MLSLFAQHASIAIENAHAFEKVQLMARIDEVTGFITEGQLMILVNMKLIAPVALNMPISLAMIDLDDFKQVNDQFSHQVGDECIKRNCPVLSESISAILMLWAAMAVMKWSF